MKKKKKRARSEDVEERKLEDEKDPKAQKIHAPGKDVEEFRNYVDSARNFIVVNHYCMMRRFQTFDFVKRMEKKWIGGFGTRAKMTVWEAFQELLNYVDSSDPDSAFPNTEHALQTAEGIRAAGMPDWFQLVGLIHDMGKIQFLWGTKEDGQSGEATGPQWALGGDTWIVGCKIPGDKVVYPEFNQLNPDTYHPVYASEKGVYKDGIGIMNATFAWGHDEYMYQMLVHNKCTIPEEGLAMVKLHSCYPWHDKGAYAWLEKEGDGKLKEWVKKFNQFDLYTKADSLPNAKELWPYYQKLIDKYMPGKLDW
jgi:inositol oxygenase